VRLMIASVQTPGIVPKRKRAPGGNRGGVDTAANDRLDRTPSAGASRGPHNGFLGGRASSTSRPSTRKGAQEISCWLPFRSARYRGFRPRAGSRGEARRGDRGSPQHAAEDEEWAAPGRDPGASGLVVAKFRVAVAYEHLGHRVHVAFRTCRAHLSSLGAYVAAA
jgi:hypothetical protein